MFVFPVTITEFVFGVKSEFVFNERGFSSCFPPGGCCGSVSVAPAAGKHLSSSSSFYSVIVFVFVFVFVFLFVFLLWEIHIHTVYYTVGVSSN